MKAVLILFATVTLFAAANAYGAPILKLNSGLLIGATGVEVSGQVYDVEFVEGNCSALFNGCNATSDFQFQTQLTAEAASQALLDNVFIDVDFSDPSTLYGYFPNLTFGCGTGSELDYCRIITPYAFELIGTHPILYAAVAQNNRVGTVDSVGGLSVDLDFYPDVQTLQNRHVFAYWTPAADSGQSTSVPEPGTLLLLVSGMAGVVALRRRFKS